MASQLQNPRDVVSGALVVATGAAFLYFGRGLTIGTASHMGSGYFPLMLSLLMIALGLGIIVNTLRLPRGEAAAAPVPWRALALIMGSIVFFALAIKGLGLFVSLVLVTLATASASRYANWRGSAVLALVVAVFCVGVFVYALGLNIPVFGRWLSPEFWSAMASPRP
jgi:hypothetical protein